MGGRRGQHLLKLAEPTQDQGDRGSSLQFVNGILVKYAKNTAPNVRTFSNFPNLLRAQGLGVCGSKIGEVRGK